MKKIYISPATAQIHVDMHPLMDGASINQSTDEATTDTNSSGEPEYINSLSRGGSLWDED